MWITAARILHHSPVCHRLRNPIARAIALVGLYLFLVRVLKTKAKMQDLDEVGTESVSVFVSTLHRINSMSSIDSLEWEVLGVSPFGESEL